MSASNALHQLWFVPEFQCLGADCEDTCCKGWGMQLSEQTVAMYRENAPELLDAVTSGEAEYVMKRDPDTDYCVKFSDGLCGIHATRGTEMLGDACHFYPRSTRLLGAEAVMTASLSCPEVVRLALFTSADAHGLHVKTDQDRLPHMVQDYAPEGMASEAALRVHQAFLACALDDAMSPEQSLLNLRVVAEALPLLSQESWADAVPFYVKQAASRLPEAQPAVADAFNVLNILLALLSASKPTARPRLETTIQTMMQALQVTLDPQQLTLVTGEGSLMAYQTMEAQWNADYRDHYAPILRRWVAVQLSLCLFPFGLPKGQGLAQRITLLSVRFATTRLALMCLCHQHQSLPDEAESVRVIQSLSRFMDHLADTTTSLALYDQMGWGNMARLRGLLTL